MKNKYQILSIFTGEGKQAWKNTLTRNDANQFDQGLDDLVTEMIEEGFLIVAETSKENIQGSPMLELTKSGWDFIHPPV